MGGLMGILGLLLTGFALGIGASFGMRLFKGRMG